MPDAQCAASAGHNSRGRTFEATCPDCGSCFDVVVPKRDRSSADHRRFFAVVAAAFAQWPSTHEFQPESAEHLRAYLLCKARHHEVEFIHIGAEIFDGLSGATLEIVNRVVQSAVRRSVEAAMRQSGRYAFDKPAGNRIAIFRPASIDWATLDQKAFNALRDEVEAIIEEIVGVPADRLLQEAEKAA